MKKSLPEIDGTAQLRLTRSGVIGEAEVLRREVAHAVSGMSPAVIVSLAMSRHPEQTAALAFASFRSEVTECLRMLDSSTKGLQDALDAKREQLASVVAAAANRGLEIVQLVSHIDSKIACSQRNDEEKRERLRQAGLTGAELETVSASTDNAELLAKRAALLAENEALQEFLRTRDEQDLPEGFAEKVHAAA